MTRDDLRGYGLVEHVGGVTGRGYRDDVAVLLDVGRGGDFRSGGVVDDDAALAIETRGLGHDGPVGDGPPGGQGGTPAGILVPVGVQHAVVAVLVLYLIGGCGVGLFLLALVAVFLVTRPLLKRLLSAQDHEVHWTWITTPASYVIRGIASYWLIDRVSGFWA